MQRPIGRPPGPSQWPLPLEPKCRDECEVEERIETLKSRLEYAKDTLQTLKDDRQQQHNFFIEVAICALLAYEVATAATPSNEALRGALEVALSYVPGR